MSTSNESVTVRVPGKINLALRCGPRRPDGYHDLATVFQAVSVYDDIVARPAEPGEFSVLTLGPYAGAAPLADDNLAVRAARAVAARAGDPRLGCHLEIHKQIPISGGMAGGSADAAGALLACATLWQLGIPADDLAAMGRDLGADVPFCLMGGTALGTGRGDQLTAVASHGTYHWVLAFARRGLTTPSVFARYDRLHPAGTAPLAIDGDLLDALAAGDPTALGETLVNDLQNPAMTLRPELRPLLDAGKELGALGAILSGSGPTVAFLTADKPTAAAFASALARLALADTICQATAPVPGAQVIG